MQSIDTSTPAPTDAALLRARYGADAMPAAGGQAEPGGEDPAQPAAIKPRLPQALVAFRERYAPHPAEAALVAKYDETLAAFSRAHGMGDVNWTGRLFARMGSVKGLNGRERMRAWMQALGFELR